MREPTATDTARPRGLGFVLGLCSGLLLYRAIANYRPLYGRRHARAPDVNLHLRLVIRQDPERVLRYWRDPAHLPRFSRRAECVSVEGSEARWLSPAPFSSLYWASRLTEHPEQHRLTWRSTEASSVRHYGEIALRPGEHGSTLCDVHLSYGLPGPLLARWWRRRSQRALLTDLEVAREVLEAERRAPPAGVPDQGLGREPITPSHG